MYYQHSFETFRKAAKLRNQSYHVCSSPFLATIARQKNIPLSVICDGMGHNSEKNTQIYLQSVDAEAIDRCNDKLIAAITKSKKKK